MTNPPDTRPYCKTMAKLVRLKVRSPPLLLGRRLTMSD